MHKYIIMGPQGSGKGTQAKLLAQSLEIVHISMGEIFRWHMAQGTYLAEQIKEHMDSGQLVPDDVVMEVVRDRLGRPDLASGFILDGFPRTPAQGEFFLRHYQVDAVLVLCVSEDLVLKRILGRRLCANCGRDFNIHFNPPKVTGKCDDCQSPVEPRGDDNTDAIRRRLETYHTKTEPVIELFRKKGLVIDIDAGGRSKDVNEAILGELRMRGVA